MVLELAHGLQLQRCAYQWWCPGLLKASTTADNRTPQPLGRRHQRPTEIRVSERTAENKHLKRQITSRFCCTSPKRNGGRVMLCHPCPRTRSSRRAQACGDTGVQELAGALWVGHWYIVSRCLGCPALSVSYIPLLLQQNKHCEACLRCYCCSPPSARLPLSIHLPALQALRYTTYRPPTALVPAR